MKQSVQVSILGQQYHLRSDASPEQVEKVARFVEEQIALVMASGKAVDSLQAAVLALLNVTALHLGDAREAEMTTVANRQIVDLIGRIESSLAGET
ncbi:MAG: hypothetical protein C0614_03805 [Desulfuromonas sp.]|nr:MAG: hypothetical protein C0614_03805 [Desulfuromonas sp.]